MEQTLTRPRLEQVPRKTRRTTAMRLCSENARAGGLTALLESVEVTRAAMTAAERVERARRFLRAE